MGNDVCRRSLVNGRRQAFIVFDVQSAAPVKQGAVSLLQLVDMATGARFLFFTSFLDLFSSSQYWKAF